MAFKESHKELLAHVANHPDVLRFIAPGAGSIDLGAFFEVEENVMFGDERGLLLFLAQPDHTFQMHYLLTEAIRGRVALKMAKNAIKTMFTNFDACAITGSTPREYHAARMMNRALGGVPVGVSQDSKGRPCIDYRLERVTWAKSSAD